MGLNTTTEPASRKVLVIGGTLFIGRALVERLLKLGHEVTILHRKSSHGYGRRVRELRADRNDAGSLKRALDGQKFDVVFDNVYDWQRGTNSTQVEATARAFSGLRRYVFVSSVAAYGDGLNHHEGNALAPDHHPDPYVRNKAMSERALFRLHQRDGFPVTTVRPPFVYGPENPFYREAYFWDRLRDRRRIIVPGDGRRLMQFAYVRDLADAMIRAAEVPAACGHAFNIGNARPVTQCELVECLAEAAGKKADLVRLPRERILKLGGSVMGPANLYFGLYFDLPPITMQIGKAQRVLGFKPTDFLTGLKETYRWYVRKHKKDSSNYSFENRLLDS